MTQSHRLAESQVDTLENELHAFISDAKQITYHNQATADRNRSIGIVRAVGSPEPGMTTLATFGLSHDSWQDVSFPDRLELVYAWNGTGEPDELRFFGEVSRTIVDLHVLPQPGKIVEDAGTRAGCPNGFPYALFLCPYLCPESRFNRTVIGTTGIWYLQVVRISEYERDFILQNGFPAFERILSEEGAMFTHLELPSYF